jgi:ubiquitin carboxyl-terminal hydrolase 8
MLMGLRNLGNTCFINSCIQILKNVYELNYYLTKNKINNVIDSTILKEWNKLVTQLRDNSVVVSPISFVSTVQIVSKERNNCLFKENSQNDMSEFIIFIIECFHRSISRPVRITISGSDKNHTDRNAILCYKMIQTQRENDYSEIQDLFYAVYISEILSLDKKILSTNPETFFILDLDIPNKLNVSIIDCLDEFTKFETLDGSNAWYNCKIQKYESVFKRLTFWSLPKILIITLKRITPCGSKKNELVEFPLKMLDLSKYVNGYNPEKYVYDLFGVSNHYGNIENGHYTAMSLDSSNEWRHYNDDSSHNISTQEVVSNYAYCLFYRIKNNQK